MVGITVGGSVVIFGEPLLRIFAPEGGAVVEAGMIRLRIMGTTYFLCGLMEVGCGALRGFGRSVTSTVISLLGACAFRVVWIYTFFDAIHTLQCLYISYPISWIITAAMQYTFCFVTLKKLKKRYADPLP